jgi:hypothetical protein
MADRTTTKPRTANDHRLWPPTAWPAKPWPSTVATTAAATTAGVGDPRQRDEHGDKHCEHQMSSLQSRHSF